MTSIETMLIASALDELEIAIRKLKAENEELKSENKTLLEIIKKMSANGSD